VTTAIAIVGLVLFFTLLQWITQNEKKSPRAKLELPHTLSAHQRWTESIVAALQTQLPKYVLYEVEPADYEHAMWAVETNALVRGPGRFCVALPGYKVNTAVFGNPWDGRYL